MGTSHLTLLTDLYELTMMQGYFKNKTNETIIFDDRFIGFIFKITLHHGQF